MNINELNWLRTTNDAVWCIHLST